MQELPFLGRGLWGKKQSLRKPEERLRIPVALLRYKYPAWDGAAPIALAKQDREREGGRRD